MFRWDCRCEDLSGNLAKPLELRQQHVNHVFHRAEGTRLRAIAVNGQRLVRKRLLYEPGITMP